VYGVKWVQCFQNNPKKGYRNVTGTIILTIRIWSYTSGMDAGYLTALRTAAVGAIAIKYLAKKDSETIGLLGLDNS
jgi:ornithine cyclodeaminase/alanine dehydrogenase